MIRLETAHIEELRGIRKLTIAFGGKTFAISGPNGSGKSGVIDAIEFGLTGNISRLTGSGTKGLSIAEHGPHVDRTKVPDAAFVTLTLTLTESGKRVQLTRRVSAPTRPEVSPNDSDVLAVLKEVAEHPEVTLSRREILRFILTEPSKRSEEIQAVLKLEQLGQLRSVLNTAKNRVRSAQRSAAAQVDSSGLALRQHLQIPTMSAADVLTAVNRRRLVLGLSALAELTTDTRPDAGIESQTPTATFNKQSALQDMAALEQALDELQDRARSDVNELLSRLDRLEQSPTTMLELRRLTFYETGLGLIDNPECPLCDAPWNDVTKLRDRVQAKVERSKEAQRVEGELLQYGQAIATDAAWLVGRIEPVRRLAISQESSHIATSLGTWKSDLEGLQKDLERSEQLMSLKARLADNWAQPPGSLKAHLATFLNDIRATPDQSSTVDAQTFLTTARIRLEDYREARRNSRAADISARSADTAYRVYCSVLEAQLDELYREVEQDFCAFYRAINEHDESSFTAKLRPEEGKVALEVNFYERGLFPPAAYHSEGHQDGMGVCLYLALMRRLYGERFSLALLDDVVMSVDAAHRKEFCRLLKSHFPGTQFVITTHDRLWAEQMKAAKLVNRNTSLVFHSWSVEAGPLVESNEDAWVEIELSLERGRVAEAAAALRRHLEYLSRALADQLGASVPFRGDGGYELGDLLPAACKRLKELYGKAAASAQSWKDAAASAQVAVRKDALSKAVEASEVERWAVNRAVHYNDWATFGKNDFRPVAKSFRTLLACFQCESCEAWLHVAPRTSPESLRCDCGTVSLNLSLKGRD